MLYRSSLMKMTLQKKKKVNFVMMSAVRRVFLSKKKEKKRRSKAFQASGDLWLLNLLVLGFLT